MYIYIYIYIYIYFFFFPENKVLYAEKVKFLFNIFNHFSKCLNIKISQLKIRYYITHIVLSHNQILYKANVN